jgi:glycosyltransferase involved in cell wall biosynthesis
MKILLVTPMPPRAQAPGAIPVLLHAQLQALLRRHDVTLVTPAGSEPGEYEAIQDLRAAGVSVRAARRVEPRGWARWQRRWRFASAWLYGQWPWRTIWFWDPEVQRLLDAEIDAGGYDLIQVEDNAMGAYRYSLQVPKVLAEYEVRRPRPVDWRAGAVAGWPQWAAREADWRRWPNYERRIWPKFDRLQVFTPRDAEGIASLAPPLAERVRVNPFGVALPELARDGQEENGLLLFVGNFTHPPNVDAALWLGQEILPRVREQAPAARLLIIGISAPPAVQALASNSIMVMGAVPDIAPYYQRASICLAPVRIGGGMRSKVLHGMAFGKPVITTARGADGFSLFGSQAPLVIAEEADSFALATSGLLASEAKRRELGRAARAFVAEHLSAEAYVRRSEAIYQEICRRA